MTHPTRMDNSRYAHELVRKLRKLSRKQRQDFWEEARICYELENGLYKEIAPSKEKFYNILGFPRPTVYYKSRLWEFYVMKHGLTPESLEDVSPKFLYMNLAGFKGRSTKNILHAISRTT